MNGDIVIACKGLAKTFDDGRLNLTVFSDIDLELRRGERIAIVGSSGAGKSTLLHILGGLDSPTAGTVLVAGREMSSLSDAERSRVRNASLGFVYQFHHLLAEFTALENVAMPLMMRRTPRNQAFETAATLLRRVGLGERLAHKPGELSGGERQRAAVARALVTRPACVLADEPTGNLDTRTAATVFELMLELNRELGTSLIVVTHDLRLAARMDRIWSLESGGLKPYSAADAALAPHPGVAAG
ncbi:MAG: lipoprotein-releasing ABC transporter ATP-binding protein LolD [Nevskia sp.]